MKTKIKLKHILGGVIVVAIFVGTLFAFSYSSDVLKGEFITSRKKNIEIHFEKVVNSTSVEFSIPFEIGNLQSEKISELKLEFNNVPTFLNTPSVNLTGGILENWDSQVMQNQDRVIATLRAPAGGKVDVDGKLCDMIFKLSENPGDAVVTIDPTLVIGDDFTTEIFREDAVITLAYNDVSSSSSSSSSEISSSLSSSSVSSVSSSSSSVSTISSSSVRSLNVYSSSSSPQIDSADINEDGFVDISDLNYLMMYWGSEGGDIGNERVDIVKDGKIDVKDLGAMISYWSLDNDKPLHIMLDENGDFAVKTFRVDDQKSLIEIHFSKAVDDIHGLDLYNYFLSPRVDIYAVFLAEDANVVQLLTERMQEGEFYSGDVDYIEGRDDQTEFLKDAKFEFTYVPNDYLGNLEGDEDGDQWVNWDISRLEILEDSDENLAISLVDTNMIQIVFNKELDTSQVYDKTNYRITKNGQAIDVTQSSMGQNGEKNMILLKTYIFFEENQEYQLRVNSLYEKDHRTNTFSDTVSFSL